jgi:carbamoyltransferase
MYILGLSFTSHDAAASLIKDGEVVAACEEERFNRKKHTKDFPMQAIMSCFSSAGITIADIGRVAVFLKPALFLRTGIYNLIYGFPRSILFLPQAIKDWNKRKYIKQYIHEKLNIPIEKIKYVEHHKAHAASAFFASPFEDAAILTVDARGEYETIGIFRGNGNSIKMLRSVKYPHSIGYLYTMVTEYLGFRPQSDEYKVMGLAAYGTPKLLEKFSDLAKIGGKNLFRLNLSYFNHHYTSNMVRQKYSHKFVECFGPPRAFDEKVTQHHSDIAYALQSLTNEALIQLAAYAKKLTNSEYLCIAGGVALNCTANSILLEQNLFKKVFIQPAANDAGASLGSALYLELAERKSRRRHVLNNVFLGPDQKNCDVQNSLSKYEDALKYSKIESPAVIASRLIYEGNVIGWMQDRMEFGPRSLGNRSILAAAKDLAIKELINSKIKHREEFRPFAPVVLEEHAGEYFELNSAGEQLYEYMLATAKVKPEKKNIIPAVIHVDGTARIQIVKKRQNRLFWELIYNYYVLSGIPVILNTSFNIQEPIVCTVDDAINTFLKSDLDCLVLENYLITKKCYMLPAWIESFRNF